MINQKEFELPKYSDLKPHFDFINIGGTAKKIDFSQSSSASLFAGQTINADDDFAAERKKREILCEEIYGLLEMKIPGTTNEAKQQKNKLIFETFNTNSKTKLEQTNSDVLQSGLNQLRIKLSNN